MIRTIIIVFAVIIFFLFSVITVPVILIAGLFDRYTRDMIALRCVQFIFRIILFLSGAKITVEGKEHVFKDRAALYALNHRGFFDILLTYVNMKRPSGFVSKIEIKKVPFLNFWMYFVRCIFLDRNDPKSSIRTIADMTNRLKGGCSVCICPEGTRNRTEQNLLPFKSGSFRVALKAGTPVVPVAVYNTNAVLEDHFPRIRPAKVFISFLEPIETAQLKKSDTDALCQQVYDAIDRKIESFKQAL